MNENNELRRYLIRRFLTTLLVVGIAQTIVNALLSWWITPLISNALSMDGLLTATDIKSTYLMLFQAFCILLLNRLLGIFSLFSESAEALLASIFDQTAVQSLTRLSESMNGLQATVYITMALFFALLMLTIWLLPYIWGALHYAKVVSKKVEKLEEIRKAKDRENEKQKNLLLSDVAHDIKTPITTTVGFSKALADGEVPPEDQQQYLEAIYNKSMQVSQLVTLLFDYVKLDSAGYQLHPTSEDFNEIVRGCIAKLYTDFEEKEMDPDINIPESSFFVNVDKPQLERAINNILTNTIKHNPEKTPVTIQVTKTTTEAILQISDMGPAIDSETASHLFDPFVQGDKSRTSGSGSGLGLSITRKIVEMHKGSVRLIQYKNPDRYNKTKTFEVRIPLKYRYR